ncbi:helix-turn-helix domain-containing protein [Bdellovibrio sp.]|uniref:helix-turn-helix domain-containing protein n=1 Tax=Bdellovibrio sp. TaxID=28201 RepID=UPI0039E6B16D
MRNDQVKEILRSIIWKRKRDNPRMSLRQLAARMGIASGRLSELLSGKRTLTKYYFEKIAKSLVLEKNEEDQLRMAVAGSSSVSDLYGGTDQFDNPTIEFMGDYEGVTSSFDGKIKSRLRKILSKFERDLNRTLRDEENKERYCVSVSILPIRNR